MVVICKGESRKALKSSKPSHKTEKNFNEQVGRNFVSYDSYHDGVAQAFAEGFENRTLVGIDILFFF